VARDEAEVVVVGAGPAGAVAALELARRGRRVVLLEAKRFPRPKTCAGGISHWSRLTLRRLGLWDRVAAEGYEIRGVRVGAPSGRVAQLVGKASAVVLDRRRFDHLLAQAAVEAGAELREGCSASAVLLEDGRARGVRLAGGETVRASWVIAANGAHGRFDTDPRPRRTLWTCMASCDGIAVVPHVMEMYVDLELAPHYGWVFPESDSRANAGIGVDPARLGGRTVRELFARFLARHVNARLGVGGTIGPWRGFPVSSCATIRHHAPSGVLLAGEACRLVNPGTGEGIPYALYSGELAAHTVDEALERKAEPLDVAAAYESRLRRRSGPSLRAGDWFLRFGRPLLETAVRLAEVSWLRRRLESK
jgi:geranylgeranyl reductase family protein